MLIKIFIYFKKKYNMKCKNNGFKTKLNLNKINKIIKCSKKNKCFDI